MLKPQAFANAATVVTAVFYIICVVLSYFAQDLLVAIANSWIHSLSLESLKATKVMSPGTLVLGFVTICVLTWVTTYAMIELYNRFAKSK